MAMAKKCDRCGKLYEHYPKGKLIGNNAIRTLFKTEYGDLSIPDKTIDLCQECMSEFDKFMMKGGSSDEK